MREHAEIANALEQARKAGKKAALATVVRVYGSAYRREGAKMAVDEDGVTTGLISGGCLEADVAEVAKQVMESGVPALKSYAMDEEVVWGLGLGCPGTVEIYIEPVTQRRQGDSLVSASFERWLNCLKEETAGVLCTVLAESSEHNDGAYGRMFVSEDGASCGNLGDVCLNRRVAELAAAKFDQRAPQSETRTIALPNGKTVQVFLDVNIPPAELMIFGAGHDAIPLARLAVALGFVTKIVDPRPGYNTVSRFPQTIRIQAGPGAYADQLQIGKRTYVVVMNHHLERDCEALRHALQSHAPYIGVLGPRKRYNRLYEALKRDGIVYSEERIARIHNPIGLDIGAGTSEEIAVSIIAEILAVRSGHAGGFLRQREAIHQPAGH